MFATRIALAKMAETGQTVTTVSESSDKDGKKIQRRIDIIRTWRNMSPFAKRCLAVYVCCSMTSFAVETYVDGVSALREHRGERKAYRSKKSEFEIVREACGHDVWGKFWRGVFFPCTAISNLTPQVIVWMNPNPDPETYPSRVDEG